MVHGVYLCPWTLLGTSVSRIRRVQCPPYFTTLATLLQQSSKLNRQLPLTSPPHLKRFATLPCEFYYSKAHNDDSEGSIAECFR